MKIDKGDVFLLYSDGMPQAEIARSAGVSKQRINQIIATFKSQLRRQYVDALRTYAAANRETARRIVKTVREDREARHQDREVRMAYMQAHPRARRTLAKAMSRPPRPDEAAMPEEARLPKAG